MTSITKSGEALRASADTVSDGLDKLHIGKSGDRANNSRNFQRFLELLSIKCSNGTRFHCVENGGTCCHPCQVLQRHVTTYVDVATLEEICNTRRQGSICSYLYCNKKLTTRAKGTGRPDSVFKIDVAAQKIYRRKVYESFCSPQCIERHAEVEATAENSPMEKGIITPRALRNSNPKTVHSLLNGLQLLESCEAFNRSTSFAKPPLEYVYPRQRGSDTVDDKCIMFNYKPLSGHKNVRFTLPDADNDSDDSHGTYDQPIQDPVDSHNVASYRDFGINVAEDIDENSAKIIDSYFSYDDIDDQADLKGKSKSILECLNLFSILWYTLSTCVTYKTREFLRTGNVSGCEMDDKTKAWYKIMVPHVPEDLMSIVIQPLEGLLSTFRIGNNTPDVDEDYLTVMTYLLLYVLVYNREKLFCSGEYSHITNQEWEQHVKRLEDILVNNCKLDVDSIAVVTELLTEGD
ncbi:hypothetical protein BgAZ_200670 [Babesia gibsoni]|uniref:RTR1-type domain-containing protein n=1 Tax=Babesia gibsoni TaxID=33632 RepID=A0AAD8PE46_BABGI|nr:hypothetical protein BgAZ_200670 [Babesia gibsoni]